MLPLIVCYNFKICTYLIRMHEHVLTAAPLVHESWFLPFVQVKSLYCFAKQRHSDWTSHCNYTLSLFILDYYDIWWHWKCTMHWDFMVSDNPVPCQSQSTGFLENQNKILGHVTKGTTCLKLHITTGFAIKVMKAFAHGGRHRYWRIQTNDMYM